MEKRRLIFDIEADSLLETVSQIYCVSYQWEDQEYVNTITDPDRMKKFFEQPDTIFIGHKVLTYDLPVVLKILGVNTHYLSVVDTLGLSWHLHDHRIIHGLDAWGKDLGIEKVKVEDDQWKGLSPEGQAFISEYENNPIPILQEKYYEYKRKKEEHLTLMVKRCEEDVKINYKLWMSVQLPLLMELYEGDLSKINRVINYLGFKCDCLREQESAEAGLHIDENRVKSGIVRLEALAEGKVEKLKLVMPKTPVIKKKSKPKKFLNKKGEVSKLGLSWLEFLKEHNISEDYEGEVEYIDSYEDPNPNSVSQKKAWLYSLGWVPENIKFVRDKKTNEVSQIPQIVGKEDKTEVCPSIKKLFPKEPALEELNGLGIINHRLGILRGFLENMIEGKIYSTASSITSTMRLKHKTVVNLPAYNAPFAEEIRSSIISPPGYVLINADLAAGEDRTKRHLIYKYDPEYVLEQSTPGYDPHTNLAVVVGLMTAEEEEFYKKVDAIEDKSILSDLDIKEYKRIKDIRYLAKTTNFSATYGIGAEALARALGITKKAAQKIIDGYWERNKAVIEYCNNCQVKEVDGRKWILQEVSGHWLSLRSDKDRLSATNQSLLAYVFDLWVMFIRQRGVIVPFQYHDELMICVMDSDVEYYKEIINSSMEKVNKVLKLNVEMACSIQVGHNYANCH